jgi:hypothetical protein
MLPPGMEGLAEARFLSPKMTARLGKRLQARVHVPNVRCQCVLAQAQLGAKGMCRPCAALRAAHAQRCRDSAARKRRRARAAAAAGAPAPPRWAASCA